MLSLQILKVYSGADHDDADCDDGVCLPTSLLLSSCLPVRASDVVHMVCASLFLLLCLFACGDIPIAFRHHHWESALSVEVCCDAAAC